MVIADLKTLAETIQMSNRGVRHFWDTQTGDILFTMDEDGYEDDSKKIKRAPKRYIALPEQCEVDEHGLMEDYIGLFTDGNLARKLTQAIHSKGAFRRFQMILEEAGRIDEWYIWRDDAYCEYAMAWCEENGIKYKE